MKQKNFTYREKITAYPGVFIPPPIKLEELMAELQHPHEGESRPLINLAELPEAFIIEVAAPGLKSGDFFVSIYKNVLTISALHKDAAMSNKFYHQHEFNYCCFRREIDLPGNIDTDFLSAMYKDGILYVRLPKSKAPLINHVERMIIY